MFVIVIISMHYKTIFSGGSKVGGGGELVGMFPLPPTFFFYFLQSVILLETKLVLSDYEIRLKMLEMAI